jgi:hypothetical protein
MKISRFLLVAGVVAGVLAGTVYFLRPDRWFGEAAVAAVVEVRVVPRFAPTEESVRRDIVSDAYLGAAWNRFRVVKPDEVADANDVLTADRYSERQAQVEAWRGQLEVSIEPNFTDDHRRIRIAHRGESQLATSGELVQFLAARYAGELSAARWYDAAEGLRTAQNQLQSATTALIDAAQGRRAANKSAVLQRTTMANIVRTAAVEEKATAPKLIAPNVVEISGPTAIPTADATSKSVEGVTPTDATREAASAEFAQAELAVAAADAALRKQLDAVLAPQAAEFPVVIGEAVGQHVGQSASTWYFSAALIGLMAAAIVEAIKSRGTLAISRHANVVEEAPLAPATTSVPSTPSAPHIIQTPDDAAIAVKAPLVAVVRRRVA